MEVRFPSITESFFLLHSLHIGALCYKAEVHGFKTRWSEYIFSSVYLILQAAVSPGVHSVSNRNEYLKKKTPWSESASELYRPSDRRLSAKWLPACAGRRCHVVSVTDPSGRISRFSRQEPLLSYQVAPQFVLTRRTRSRKIMFLGIRAQPVRRADNLTAICEPTV
jgi:hypothetical protein